MNKFTDETDKETVNRLSQAAPLLAAIVDELNFTKAAERLNVQQSAISHRVRALEEKLGLTLFERSTKNLRLTAAGKILCEAARQSMSVWQPALDKLEKNQSADQIRLSLPSSLAMKWAIPILPNASSEGLSISLEVKDDLTDFHHDDTDAAIRFGVGPYPGLHAIHLTHCKIQAVVSPRFLNGVVDQSEQALLEQKMSLLSDRRGAKDNTGYHWQNYFEKTGSLIEPFTCKHQFDRADLMIQAAVSGMGIGLGRTLLIENDLKAGFLKTLGPSVNIESSYWLVCSASFAQSKRFKLLQHWLKKEIQATVNQSHAIQ
ncbi:LysR family transcriptional regulator [Agarivorans sp. Z349TD_8]|uniref:LysR family transcriptional regulator n=1 Tax=Agarivorans sp. Z349TD_8 TaxID=3421434 RepID=UPI003D7D716E